MFRKQRRKKQYASLTQDGVDAAALSTSLPSKTDFSLLPLAIISGSSQIASTSVYVFPAFSVSFCSAQFVSVLHSLPFSTSQFLPFLWKPQTFITRAHSFARPAEFRAEPWNLGFCCGIDPRNLPRNSSFCHGMPQKLTFFIRTTIFSQKMTSKQLCYKFVYDDFLFHGDG